LSKSWPGTPPPAKAPLLYVQKSPFAKPCCTGATVSKSTVLLAELARSRLVPRKSARSGYAPAAPLGVIGQEAGPVLYGVPVHVWPASAKCSVALGSATGGEAEISTSVAVSGSGVFTVPLPRLVFRLRNVVCGPVVHATCATLEVNVCVSTVAVAIR